jgi:hypothetical protein
MSSYRIYAGNKKALVFPIMGDAYVHLDYSKHITDEVYGLWGHKESFTIEAIVTPYDVNGFGYRLNEGLSGSATAHYTEAELGLPYMNRYYSMPAPATTTNSRSNSYLSYANRLEHKMTLFYNTNCEFYLENLTRTNMNQPAEYKLGCTIKGKDENGTTKTITITSRSPVITASNQYYLNPIKQTLVGMNTFGKPLFLDGEDVVRYHAIRNDSDSSYAYIERPFREGVSTEYESINGGSNAITFSGSTIVRASGTWSSNIQNNTYLKVVGSANNDGYYKILSGGGSNTLTISTTLTSGTDTSNPIVFQFVDDNASRSHRFYQAHFKSSGSDNAVDMVDSLWIGMPVYSQTHAGGVFASSASDAVTPDQTQPIALGYVGAYNITTEVADLYGGKLAQAITATDATTIYVDDSRYFTINRTIEIDSEQMRITAISGNALTVTRGYDTTSVSTSTAATHSVGANIKLYLPDDFMEGFRHRSSGAFNNPKRTGVFALTDATKEINYVLRPFHVAMGYDRASQKVSIYLDGAELQTDVYNADGTITFNFTDFEFDESDCYFGSNGNTTLATRRASQFMGEMHELCITGAYKDSFQTIDTLVPNYRNTLLYYRFEEANL